MRVPSVDSLAKDLAAAGIPIQDERGWRVDFHALRHTYASLLGAAGVSEGARVKMVRHSEWRQTDNYTDPNSVPLHAGMEKLSLLLPSSIASPKFGKLSPRVGKGVQSDSPTASAEVVAFATESPALLNAVPSWENVSLASPRGFEPLVLVGKGGGRVNFPKPSVIPSAMDGYLRGAKEPRHTGNVCPNRARDQLQMSCANGL